MSKVAIVYWSGTGNTEMMANAVKDGASSSDVSLFTASEFDASMVDDFDAIAFGCPAMGAEVLEESEFEPMFSSILSKLNGKKIALFGSYGWGEGAWMRDWESTCLENGANLVCDSVICNGTPNASALSECEALGKALV